MTQPTIVGTAAANPANVVDGATLTTSTSISVQTGDKVLVLGADADNIHTLATPTISGGTGVATFTAMAGTPTNVASSPKMYAWTADVISNGTNQTFSCVSGGGNTGGRGFAVIVARGCSGFGTPVVVTSGTAISASLTRVGVNSHVAGIMADWQATNDIVYVATPSGQTTLWSGSVAGVFVSGEYTSFALRWGDQGTTGTTSYGMASGFATAGPFSKIFVEIKGSAGQSINVNQALETDTAGASGKVKVKSFGQALETDTGQVFGRSKSKAFGQASETDTAQILVHTRSKTILQTVETDSAQLMGRKKAKAFGQALETDTSFAITKTRSRTLLQALETDTGQPFGKKKSKLLGLCTETDTAGGITKSGAKNIAVSQAVETDTSGALGKTKSKSLLQALETDSAQVIGRNKKRAMNLCSETDTGFAIGHKRGVAVLRCTENDTARPISTSASIVLGQVLETDSGRLVGHSRVRLLGLPFETDTGRTLAHLKGKALGKASELDTARSFSTTVPPDVTPLVLAGIVETSRTFKQTEMLKSTSKERSTFPYREGR